MSEKHFVVILEKEGRPANVVGPFSTENSACLWGVVHGAYSVKIWEVMSPEDYAIELTQLTQEFTKDVDFGKDD